MGEWTNIVLGSYLSFRNGKTSPARSELGAFTVFGSNGAIGRANEANADAGTIIVGRVGTYCGSLHFSSSPCWVTDNAIICTPPQNEGRFWVYALSSLDLNNYRAGSGQPLLNQSILKQINFRVPTVSERLQIGACIGALDDKIELNRRMNETLEAMARTIFKDWFVDFGPTRAKAEGRAPYLAPDLWDLFPDALDNEDKPVGWNLKPVSNFATIKGGKQLSRDRFVEDGRIPVFGGAGLMGYTDSGNADGFVVSVGRVGAYCGQFFSHRGKAWINNNASLITPANGVFGEWLVLALRALNIDLIKKGAAQPFVSNSDIAAMNVVDPGEVVLAAFHDRVIGLVLRQEANQRESATLAQTRDLLLPKLMSGEIRLREAERAVEAVA